MESPGRLKILHVDDDPVNLHVLNEILKSLGHEPHPAPCAHDALDLLKQQAFDLLITDLHMPEVGGRELMEAARKLEMGRTLPVLAISADVMSHRPDEYLAIGFVGFLSKPLMLGQLEGILAGLASAPDASPPRARRIG